MTAYQQRIQYLLRRFANDQANEAEVSELLDLLDADDEIQGLDEFLLQLRSGYKPELVSVDEGKLWQKIHREAVPVRRMSRNWWMAAASFIVLAVAGWWVYDHWRVTKPGTTEVAKATDVSAPSANRATITLADGRKIYLDSANNGTIVRQDNVEVTRLKDGQLTYNVQRITYNSALPVLYHTLTNPRGSRVIDITLSDGSRIWLNAESSLRYPIAFNGNDRKVDVTGEAYFEVAHDESKPFVVSKGNMNITVLGTHFNVNAYDDEEPVKVTLLEGSVKVSELTTHDSRLIKPGEQIIVKANSPFTIDHSPDIESVMAWKNGRFSFSNTPLKTIMKELMRWYDIDVIYEGVVEARFFTADISREKNLSSVLKILELSNIHFRLEGKKLIVTK